MRFYEVFRHYKKSRPQVLSGFYYGVFGVLKKNESAKRERSAYKFISL